MTPADHGARQWPPAAITDGSLWWTILPPAEGDSLEPVEPRRVKAWRRLALWHAADPIGSPWRLSSFDENGEVDDDSNATSYHTDADVGRTLFSEEAEAWRAYLGDAPDPVVWVREQAVDLARRVEWLTYRAVTAHTVEAHDALLKHADGCRAVRTFLIAGMVRRYGPVR